MVWCARAKRADVKFGERSLAKRKSWYHPELNGYTDLECFLTPSMQVIEHAK